MPTNLDIWPGSGSAISGSTPFGLYDNDTDFQKDALNIAKWITMKLGYPLIQVEINDKQIYACFEEAVSEYSTQVNNNNVRNWLTTLIGSSTSSDYTNKLPQETFNYLKRYTNAIASEVGAGGYIDWKTGSIELKAGIQNYDLQSLWGAVSESGQRIQIKEVWHYSPSAMQKYFSPYMYDGQMLVQSEFENFGSAGYETAMYYMMPVYYDVLRAQAIELSDSIRKSNYSYEIINNKLRITPIPGKDFKLYFRYTLVNQSPIESSDNSLSSSFDGISNISNIPYEFLTYKSINSMGKQWIRKYTLSLSMELLGCIRRKYSTIPIPTGDVTLDGDLLIQQGKEMREALLTELKELLKDMSIDAMSERSSNEKEKLQLQLNRIPLLPYIG